MLVDMGDLPQPDNNVLSETLWNSELNTPPAVPSLPLPLPLSQTKSQTNISFIGNNIDNTISQLYSEATSISTSTSQSSLGQSGGSMKTTGKERNIINYHIFNFIILCFFMINIGMIMILFSHIFMMLNVIFNRNRNILYYMLP